jgi:hypothetical protein
MRGRVLHRSGGQRGLREPNEATSPFRIRAGCLVSMLAPIVAIVIYPNAKWLFALPLVGIGILVLQFFRRKDPTPQEIADHAERLLSGQTARWEVDDYEHLNPKDPALNDLWRSTMAIGGLPEMWTALDEEKQTGIRKILSKLRQMGDDGHESSRH